MPRLPADGKPRTTQCVPASAFVRLQMRALKEGDEADEGESQCQEIFIAKRNMSGV